MQRLSWGTPVKFINPHTGTEQEGYYATCERSSDVIVTVGADGKGTYPHYRVDGIKWREQYANPNIWNEPTPEMLNRMGQARAHPFSSAW